MPRKRRTRSAWEKRKIAGLRRAGLLASDEWEDDRVVLEWAISSREPKEVARLLKWVSVADCESLGENDDCNLLHTAAKLGSPEIVQLLLDAGVDPNISGRHGVALRYAAIEGHKDVYALLKKKTKRRFHRRSRMVLQDQTRDRTEKRQAFEFGRTALEGRTSTLRKFVERGMDPGARSYALDGNTPLHLAAIGGHEDLVRYLSEAGADANATSYSGMTPIFFAHTKKVCVELLKGGADVAVRSDDGVSAIMRAYTPDVFRELEKAGADFTQVDVHSNGAPIHMLSHLLDNKYSPCPKNVKIDDKLDGGVARLVRKLVRQGVPVNGMFPESGWTALMIACDLDMVATASALIKAGADTEVRDKQGNSALDLTRKRSPIRKLLT